MIEKPNASIRAGGKTYSPNEVHAILARLAQLGINRDKIIAQITPEEAMVLKRLGGSGKINPKTGLLSFDDDGGGDDGGGDDGGGEGEGSGGGEYDGGGSYDGYGGGWEGGTGGTYGGEAGYGDFDAGAFADAVAANNEAMSAAIEDAASYSADPDAPAPGAQQAGFWSDVRGYFGGPPISKEAPPGYPPAQSLIATPGGSSYWGGTPSIESQLPTIEAPGPLYGFEPAPGVTLDMPFSEGFIPGTGPGAPLDTQAGLTPEEIADLKADQDRVAAEEAFFEAQFPDIAPPGPLTGFGNVGPYGGDINTTLSAAANPFGLVSDDVKAAIAQEAARSANTQSVNWTEFADRYNANNAAPSAGTKTQVSTAPASGQPPTEVATLPVAEPEINPFGPSGLPDIGAFPDSGDTGGTEWVNPTELVPKVEEPVLIDKGGLESPPVPTTPVVAAPVLPTQLIDWYHYGESNPEFGYYQSDRVPTPYKAHGGYFDADAYFAEGGLVSEPRAPVQPAVASAPTMAYTDGQGMVGSIAAPPALSPYDAYGSDAQHASPMAPAPAAAAPSIGGPLEMLASRNKNAMPFPSQISQNPNLGYSLGMSPLSRLRG